MHGKRGIALGIELDVLGDLVGAHIADYFHADLEVAGQLLELVLHLGLVGMGEIGHVVGDGREPGRLGEGDELLQRHHLHMLLGALGDVELGGEAGHAVLGEHGLQLLLGHRGLELHLRGDVRQVLSHLHKKPLPIRQSFLTRCL